MATITINIPVDKEEWVLNGLAIRYGHEDTIPNPLFDEELEEDSSTNPATIPNPQSKAQFAKARIIDHIKAEVTQGYILQQWDIHRVEEENLNIT